MMLNTNSVNTVFLDKDNRLVGENTDVFGIQAAYLKEIPNVEKRNALVIGAGGGVSNNKFISKVKNKKSQL